MPLLAPTPESIAHAAATLRAGGIVAFPTETVYGLGADACNAAAVAAVFAAKGRPSFNPLMVHALDINALTGEAVFDARAEDVAAHFWPGPLAMVLPLAAGSRIAPITCAGLSTVAVRVPSHPVARDLLQAFGGLVAAPSANKSESLSPTTPKHVHDSLGTAAPLILVGGKTTVGLESTIIDLTTPTPRLLRAGGIAREDIERIIGPLAAPDDVIKAPGMMLRHYAPSKPLRLNADSALPTEAFLMFGPVLKPSGKVYLNLSETGDVAEAAANLFSHLHTLQAADVTGIAVMPIPAAGLGLAINDRLQRGAQNTDGA
jgi:L-threonylcarbamoyladenylate synthase